MIFSNNYDLIFFLQGRKLRHKHISLHFFLKTITIDGRQKFCGSEFPIHSIKSCCNSFSDGWNHLAPESLFQPFRLRGLCWRKQARLHDFTDTKSFLGTGKRGKNNFQFFL